MARQAAHGGRSLPTLAAATLLVAGTASLVPGATASAGGQRIRHVLLISVDGLHQSDVDWFVDTHPHSTLASLVAHGVDYTEAATPIPSDSFPGMVAQATAATRP